jgi:1-acyl-sn-glycerol-3-phosphate acyltransferase
MNTSTSTSTNSAATAYEALGGTVTWYDRIVYRTGWILVRSFARVYWRAKAHDAHHFPRSGPVIVSPVHRSNLDVPLLGATAPRRLRYLAKDSLFAKPFWRWFLTMLGGFPLRRSASLDREALRASQAVLDRGEPLVVFPEGERKHGPRVFPLLDGAVWLSVKTGVPILPVGIGGSFESMPKGARFPRPSHIVYLYGPLVHPPQPDSPGARVSRERLRAHSAALRETIQDLYDEAQRRAGYLPLPNTHELLAPGEAGAVDSTS